MHKLYQSLMGNRNVGQPINNVQVNPVLQSVKNIFGLVSGSSNPMQVILGLASKNPTIQDTMNISNQSGKSYEQIFYDLAKQKGVDPNSVLNQLKF